MPIISSIEYQKKDKNRVNVFIDGDFFCGANLDMVVVLRLYNNREMTDDEIAELKRQSVEKDMYGKALEYALGGMKTKRQISEYLWKKEIKSDDRNTILEKLEKNGYINDELYARTYVAQKGAKLGKRMIRAKLMQKGISGEIIDSVIIEVDSDDQDDRAIEVAEKYMRNKEGNFENYGKLYRYLAGKGFESQSISVATAHIKELKLSEDEEQEEDES